MTIEERQAIRAGDHVMIRMQGGRLQKCKVRFAPWQRHDLTWSIGVFGFSEYLPLGLVESVCLATGN